jgi:hypothetical protein
MLKLQLFIYSLISGNMVDGRITTKIDLGTTTLCLFLTSKGPKSQNGFFGSEGGL